MLKDVVNRIKSEIDNEKKMRYKIYIRIRETTEETILNLLEDTCNKLNSAQLAWFYLIFYL